MVVPAVFETICRPHELVIFFREVNLADFVEGIKLRSRA